MNEQSFLFLIGISLFLIIGCRDSREKNVKSEKEKTEQLPDLRGFWKVDSIQVYKQDSLKKSTDFEFVFEMSKRRIKHCDGAESMPPSYSVIEMEDGNLGLKVISDQGTIRSNLKVLDTDHFYLKKYDTEDVEGDYKMWYHSRTDEERKSEYCNRHKKY